MSPIPACYIFSMIEMGGSSQMERDRRFIRSDIAAIQESDARIDEQKLDKLLGVVGDFKKDEDFIGASATTRFPREKWGYQGTRYETIRATLRAIESKAGETFYDLGSGQGRVVLYGALASEAKFVGIELLQERVDACNRAKARLGIQNVEFRAGSVTEMDVSDGNFFYLFNPFNPGTRAKVVENLRGIAEKKKIKIICTGGIEMAFEGLPWLRRAAKIMSPEPIEIFESISN